MPWQSLPSGIAAPMRCLYVWCRGRAVPTNTGLSRIYNSSGIMEQCSSVMESQHLAAPKKR